MSKQTLKKQLVEMVRVSVENDESHAKELIEAIADSFDVKGLFADNNPGDVLEVVDNADIIEYLMDQGYEVGVR